MYLLDKFETFIFSTKKRTLLFLLFALSIFKSGIWSIPNLPDYLIVAHSPFQNMMPVMETHYIFSSWFGPLLAWVLGIKTLGSFFLFHLFFSLAFSLIAYSFFYLQKDDRSSRMMAIAFTLMPAAVTHYYWVSADSLTLFLILLIVLFRKNLGLAAAFAIALGMQHFEQGFFAFFAVLFAAMATDKKGEAGPVTFQWSLAVLASVVLGRILLYLVFKGNGIEIKTDRMDWLVQHLPQLLDAIFLSWPTTLWSFLSVGWLIALSSIDQGKAWRPFFFGLLVVIGLAPISADQTRVLTIVAFPLYLLHIVLNEKALAKVSTKAMSAFLILWILIPWVWVWNGQSRPTFIMRDFSFLFNVIRDVLTL